jgi:hypothetical protein
VEEKIVPQVGEIGRGRPGPVFVDENQVGCSSPNFVVAEYLGRERPRRQPILSTVNASSIAIYRHAVENERAQPNRAIDGASIPITASYCAPAWMSSSTNTSFHFQTMESF